MSAVTSTHEKALSINLDDKIYGTIAEIGAAQEVARWFFRVGGAAGSIAKTISAYDMTFSDEIYGKSDRYVSRGRLESMLDKEYDLLIRRLWDERGHNTRFFAFSDTVSARNYRGTNECHGWMGIRFQHEVGAEPSTVILHVNMLDKSNVRQQEALGTLGVNLVHGVFLAQATPLGGLDHLSDNLARGRLEVDVADLSGPAFEEVDPARIGLKMVQSGLAEVILFNRSGVMEPPTEILRKRPIIIKRTSRNNPMELESRMLDSAWDKLRKDAPELKATPIGAVEYSVSSVYDENDAGNGTLEHLRMLMQAGDWTMLTSIRQNYKLTDYLRRYSQQPTRFVMGVSTFAMLLSEKFYEELPGRILEATGKLFADDVKIYVRAMESADFRAHLASAPVAQDWVCVPESGLIEVDQLAFKNPTQLLYQYLMETGWVEKLD